MVVPFNDLVVLERVLHERRGAIAGMIMEPMMMNAGIVAPLPGYLEGVREITRIEGVLLAFDEVKTGLTVGPGGATQLFGVVPDIVCVAKAMVGGLPCGAIGGTHEVMSAIADGRYDQVGTFNGSPLTMAAARATLTEVLTPAAYHHFDTLGRIMVDGALDALREQGIAAYGHRYGAKGWCRVLGESGSQLPRFSRDGHRAQPLPLAVPAQRRSVPTTVGQERTVDVVGAAHRGRRRPVRRKHRQVRGHRRRAPKPRLGARRDSIRVN
ncbi:MAG: aminotransferase class III-fold pyridoxal phosphate-dependent enzyme [Acidimicrobiales bacterium]